ncbi:T9SS type A sorting domain-containing protein [Fulvivirgaceae bacterium BMA12]|uniref:T9SS type A sorting domain-containing protein n=1 Tax=Agaribacillus aureus TaxID=3051825 RepID=A0ABT8L5B6_9BACT|nr:T9SS type A sorting domain-containing protein [Fulvivirgaceae bacterium BMA12]
MHAIQEKMLKWSRVQFCCITVLTIGIISPSSAQLKANVQDSLLLLQFQKELMQKGWPQLWDTDQWVSGWGGVLLHPVNGKVTSISMRGDKLTKPFETDSLPAAISTLQSLDSLKHLAFALLGLKYVPKEIGDFKSLESLGLVHNKLEDIPTELNNLTELKQLFLTNNRLTDLPDLSGLSNLEVISVSSNKMLKQVPSTIFSLTTLTRLDIGYTGITTMPEQISLLTNLETLNADGAALTSLPDAITQLPKLSDLKLANNQLTSLPVLLGDLQNLISLDLTRNRLTKLPASMNQLLKLRQIRFSDNQLTEFPVNLVGLPGLRFIYGERNQMEGEIPQALFNIIGLRLFLEGNELSGKLAIKAGKIPERLYIKNNRFTLKDIIERYKDFDSNNNTFIEFYPQKKIGTSRTFHPAAGVDFNLSIDNYTPATGAKFAWYRLPGLAGGASPMKASEQEKLVLPVFDPVVDGGIYYCIVTHPDLPNISLQSHRVRVIGVDLPPSITIKDLVFRQGNVPGIIANVKDDYTAVEDLNFSWPEETDHFKLEKDLVSPLKNKRLIHPKDPVWTGSDTVTVNVTDENGNLTATSATITVLPPENEIPQINVPPIYMNIFQDIELPCTPGTTGCNAFYPFVSKTYLKYFVSDDLTPARYLDYRIIEADPLTGKVTDKVNMALNPQPEGITLDATVLAHQDTTVIVTLEVKDEEGGMRQKQIQFIAKAIMPNMSPRINTIPEQVILKGTPGFPALNLNQYVDEDYVAHKNLVWVGASLPNLSVEVRDSTAFVRPAYADSSYSGSITYIVSEKTNYDRTSFQVVKYSIVDGLTISGSIKDGNEKPLAGVEFKGFPTPVVSDASGNFEASVLPGWSGTVIPALADYIFQPSQIKLSNVTGDLSDQDFVATYIGKYIISGTVLNTSNEPIEGVSLSGFPDKIFTDQKGIYQAKVPAGWSGTVSPVKGNVQFNPGQMEFTNVRKDLYHQNFHSVLINGVTADKENILKIFPNPSTEEVEILLTQPINTHAKLEIITPQGKLIKQYHLHKRSKSLRWEGKDQNGQVVPSGIYMCRIIVDDRLITTTKIVRIK